jgi:Ca2+/Na+ antiporter
MSYVLVLKDLGQGELERRRRIQRKWRVAVHAIIAQRYFADHEAKESYQVSAGGTVTQEQDPADSADDEAMCGNFFDQICTPIMFLFEHSIPDCRKPQWEKYYGLTFFASIVWIAILAFAMVTLASKVACIVGIPEIVMGVTVLAAGTSVPDCLGSIIAARQGMGGMAVANAIGSNVFDICIGLGLPWIIKSWVSGSFVLWWSFFFLFFSFFSGTFVHLTDVLMFLMF